MPGEGSTILAESLFVILLGSLFGLLFVIGVGVETGALVIVLIVRI